MLSEAKPIISPHGLLYYYPHKNVLSNAQPEYILGRCQPLEQALVNSELPPSLEELKWYATHRLKQVILELTESCNMRCRYCTYYHKYNNKTHSMSDEIIYKGIDLLFENSDYSNRIALSFYGGEALLEFDKIVKAVKYAKSKICGQKLTFVLTTNGLLLEDPDIVDFLVDNDFYLTISIDGNAYQHDRYRIDIAGNATHEKIVNAIKDISHRYPQYFRSRLHYSSVVIHNDEIGEIYRYFDGTRSSISPVEVTRHFNEYLKTVGKQAGGPGMFNIKDLACSSAEKMIGNLHRFSFTGDSSPQCAEPSGICYPLTTRTFIRYDGIICQCEKADETDPLLQFGDVFSGFNWDAVKRSCDEINEKTSKNCAYCWALRFCPVCLAHLSEIDFYGETCIKYILQVEQEYALYLRLKQDYPGLLERNEEASYF